MYKTDQISQKEKKMANMVGEKFVELLYQLIKPKDNKLN